MPALGTFFCKNTVTFVPFALRGCRNRGVSLHWRGHQTKPTKNTGEVWILFVLMWAAWSQHRTFRPIRLEAAKKVAADFRNSRGNDRIGVVILPGRVLRNAPSPTGIIMCCWAIENIHNGFARRWYHNRQRAGHQCWQVAWQQGKIKVVGALRPTDGENNVTDRDPQLRKKISQNFRR